MQFDTMVPGGDCDCAQETAGHVAAGQAATGGGGGVDGVPSDRDIAREESLTDMNLTDMNMNLTDMHSMMDPAPAAAQGSSKASMAWKRTHRESEYKKDGAVRCILGLVKLVGKEMPDDIAERTVDDVVTAAAPLLYDKVGELQQQRIKYALERDTFARECAALRKQRDLLLIHLRNHRIMLYKYLGVQVPVDEELLGQQTTGADGADDHSDGKNGEAEVPTQPPRAPRKLTPQIGSKILQGMALAKAELTQRAAKQHARRAPARRAAYDFASNIGPRANEAAWQPEDERDITDRMIHTIKANIAANIKATGDPPVAASGVAACGNGVVVHWSAELERLNMYGDDDEEAAMVKSNTTSPAAVRAQAAKSSGAGGAATSSGGGSRSFKDACSDLTSSVFNKFKGGLSTFGFKNSGPPGLLPAAVSSEKAYADVKKQYEESGLSFGCATYGAGVWEYSKRGKGIRTDAYTCDLIMDSNGPRVFPTDTQAAMYCLEYEVRQCFASPNEAKHYAVNKGGNKDENKTSWQILCDGVPITHSGDFKAFMEASH